MELAQLNSKTSGQAMLAMQGCLESLCVEGDIVECGVWRGGNLILARSIRPERRIWAYDTFAGMTKPTKVDRLRNGLFALSKWPQEGWMAASLEEVKRNVGDNDSIKYIVGDVCETLRVKENIPEKIALLRLDTDWYESTKIELEVLWPCLVKGGHLLVDDYGHWMGAKQAVDEFFSPDQRSWMKMIDYTVAHMVKQ